MPKEGYKTIELLRQAGQDLGAGLTSIGNAALKNRELDIQQSKLDQERLKEKRSIAGAAKVAENLSNAAQLPQGKFAKREAVLTPLQERAQFVYNQIINPDPNIREQGIKEAFAITKELNLDPSENRFYDLENRIIGLQVDASTAEAEGDLKKAEALRNEEERLTTIFQKHLVMKTRLKSSAQAKPLNIAMAKWIAKQPLTDGEEALLIRYYTGPLQDLSKSGKGTERVYQNAQKFIRQRGGYDKPLPGQSIGQPPLSNQSAAPQGRPKTTAEIANEVKTVFSEYGLAPIPQLDETDLQE